MFEDRGDRWREMPEPGFVDRPVRDVIPDLDSIPPGPYLAAILASIDRTKLNGYDLWWCCGLTTGWPRTIRRRGWRTWRRWLTAWKGLPTPRWPASRSVSSSPPMRSGPPSPLTRRSAESQLGLAVEFAERLPRILEEFKKGRLSLPKVWVIIRATSHLPAETAAEVANWALEHAEAMTTSQLASWMRRLCIEVDPESAAKRYEESLADRRSQPRPTWKAPPTSMRWSWSRIGCRLRCAGSTTWRKV